ncbi:homogentisate 1,2-dioxygenase [Sediminibacterium sp.]|uniref:homogentisate 1,2-dioxygenase n=1 Tax=Sediminibacterium sp. TaxID=1917865 RepID=UPI00271FBFC4|nr:homogentisate 1,2-dioxygenase [Sediminibacterium sp.]MDO9157368.1 homogentisate 1,2-dioxygenase [Sediminibacterium sp.]MDP1973463.1 homogentisate 1,2-dioxygenase [Sediminibacterium sp.]MDP2421010.1 homogentisate 1,2-dioxygenase [Sediminibacterium sp.]
MPHYIKLGSIPHKRHTQFRKPDGGLYSEQLFSTEGFSDDYSLFYHIHPPTQIIHTDEPIVVAPKVAEEKMLKHRSFEGFKVQPEADYLNSRKAVLVNNDCHIVLAAPQQSMTSYFYKNADADELIFIHEGTGKLLTQYGQLAFSYGDYIVIPRGTIYQIHFDQPENRLFIVESFSPFRYPKRYLSKHGQLLEHSPYCERDIRGPENLVTIDEKGDFLIKTKKKGVLYGLHYGTHPFDVIGWDGCCYPYIFSIHDFEPITGRVHQPPPVHQTFDAHNFVVCSFCPRLYDYHPDAIPAPYNHSNIDSDEVLYYVAGDFMSRKHVTRGMITLHPAGIPHGPHPGAVEKSIGKKETQELAVMVDTFHPLQLTEEALRIENLGYTMSWAE